MDNFIILALREAKTCHKIVSLHTDPSDLLVCSVGYVEQMTDDEIRLHAISPEGESTGYLVRPLQEIYRVDVDGMYEKKIHFLSKNQGNVFKEAQLENPIEENGLIFTTLQEAQQKHKIVVLWTQDKEDSIIGYIEDVNAEAIKILSITDYGQEDGDVVIDIHTIISLEYNSITCQLLEYLHDHWDA